VILQEYDNMLKNAKIDPNIMSRFDYFHVMCTSAAIYYATESQVNVEFKARVVLSKPLRALIDAFVMTQTKLALPCLTAPIEHLGYQISHSRSLYRDDGPYLDGIPYFFLRNSLFEDDGQEYRNANAPSYDDEMNRHYQHWFRELSLTPEDKRQDYADPDYYRERSEFLSSIGYCEPLVYRISDYLNGLKIHYAVVYAGNIVSCHYSELKCSFSLEQYIKPFVTQIDALMKQLAVIRDEKLDIKAKNEELDKEIRRYRQIERDEVEVTEKERASEFVKKLKAEKQSVGGLESIEQTLKECKQSRSRANSGILTFAKILYTFADRYEDEGVMEVYPELQNKILIKHGYPLAQRPIASPLYNVSPI